MGFDGGDFLRLGKKIVKKGMPLLGGVLGGPVGSAAMDIISAVTGTEDPKEALALLEANPDLYGELQKEELAHKTRLEELFYDDMKDRRALIKAEIQSEDVYVRRARPTFLYIMYGVIVFNFIILPFIRIFNPGVPAMMLPGELYWLFGTAFTGYGVMRTVDKQGKTPKNIISNFLNIGGDQ